MDVLQWQHVASLGCWGRAMCAGARRWRPGKWWRPYFSNMGCHFQQQWGCCGQCFWGFNCQGIDNHTRWMWGNWGIFSSGELYNLVGLVDYPIHGFCRINSLLCKVLVMFSGFLWVLKQMWTIHVAKLQIMVTLNSFGTCGEQQSQHVQQHFLAMRAMYIVSNSTNQMYTHSPAFLCLMHAFEDSAFSYKEVQCCICTRRLWCNFFQECWKSMCEQKLSTLRMMQNYVVTGGYDKTVRLWDARTGALLRTFIGHNSAVSRVIFNPLGNLVISGCVIAQPGLSIGLGGRSEIMICWPCGPTEWRRLVM